jgi:PTH1 family peptidyl-tRNA hydrolase
MFVIIGLGNPGKKYENTRHNIGFNIINVLATDYSVKINQIKHKSLVGTTFINGEKVMLVKPQTYMNNSGEAVREIIEYYKVPLEKVLIVYDDVDTKIGSIRIRTQGSGGSHNGMNNIIYLLNCDNIPRLRFGIERSETIPLRNYVLNDFDKNNIGKINETIKKSVEACKIFINSGINKAMNDCNG